MPFFIVFDTLKCPFFKVAPLHFQFLAGTLNWLIFLRILKAFHWMSMKSAENFQKWAFMFHIILLEVVFSVQMQSKIVLFIRPQEFCSYVMALSLPSSICRQNSCFALSLPLSFHHLASVGQINRIQVSDTGSSHWASSIDKTIVKIKHELTSG